MRGGLSIVFTQKAVVNEAFIRDSSNICQSIVGINASQLYLYSMCHDMPTGLYTRGDFDCDRQKCKARHNQSRNLETRPEGRIETFDTSGSEKKIDCSNVNEYCDHCKTVSEAVGCYFFFCPGRETCPSLNYEDIER